MATTNPCFPNEADGTQDAQSSLENNYGGGRFNPDGQENYGGDAAEDETDDDFQSSENDEDDNDDLYDEDENEDGDEAGNPDLTPGTL